MILSGGAPLNNLLREYQIQIIEKTRQLMLEGKRRILIQSPTGSGKTVLTAHMIKTAYNKGRVCWFNVHRRELVKQSSLTFYKYEIPHGIISSGWGDARKESVQITSIQSLIRRYKNHKPPNLIVWDECHHIASKSWENIFSAFPQSFHIGLTATPQRLDGRGLGDYFDEMILGPSVRWLIDNKYLADYSLYAPSKLDVSALKTKMGDFTTSSIETELEKNKIVGCAVDQYLKLCPGARNVVFCASVKGGIDIAERFTEKGIPAKCVHGKMDTGTRDSIIHKFKAGEVKVLTNCDIFGEGFDVPAIEVVQLLRPTQSLGLYLQQVGRALRPKEHGGKAIILDHVGNWERHGFPDEERQWSLDGQKRTRKNSESVPSVVICEFCFGANTRQEINCRSCGQPLPKKEREIEEVEGDLKEVDKKIEMKKNRQAQGKANSIEALIELGKTRGYKNPYAWAHHVFNGRKRS